MNGPDQAEFQFALPLLSVLFGPSGDWTMSLTRRREIFTQWADANANLSQKHPHRYTQQ